MEDNKKYLRWGFQRKHLKLYYFTLGYYGFVAVLNTGCVSFETGARVTCFIAPVQSLCVNVITPLLLLGCLFPAATLHHKAAQWI